MQLQLEIQSLSIKSQYSQLRPEEMEANIWKALPIPYACVHDYYMASYVSKLSDNLH